MTLEDLTVTDLTLADLGWDASRDSELSPHGADGHRPARIAAQHRDLYQLLTEDGECAAVVTGRFRHTARSPAEFPAVGDWVVMQPAAVDGPAAIHAVLPRRSRFSRRASGRVPYEQVIAANVDTLFIVSGLDGNHNLRRLERYVTQGWDSGAVPVVLLNKADLCADPHAAVEATRADLLGVDVHAVCGERGNGMEALTGYLAPGRTVALVGSSGVGKSTLVNRIVGGERMATHAVRQGDARGRHTTTHRELIVTPAGALLIDTPGMREFALWADGEPDDGATDDGEADALDAFEDIAQLARRCRFPDCRHMNEPGCRVAEAVQAGQLDYDRVRSYRALVRERGEGARRAAAGPRVHADGKRRAKRADRRRTRRQLRDGADED